MLTITIDPIVLERLSASFPKPKNSAANALKKYKELLEQMLFKVIQRGRSTYETLLNCYFLPVAELTHKGPHIGPQKVRLHKWLKENELNLVEVVDPGTNLTGLVSLVKFTELVVLEGAVTELSISIASAATTAEISQILSGDPVENQELFAALYPDYYTYLSATELEKVFDIVPIDIASLEAYVVWLNTKSKQIMPGRVRTYTEQALLILAIARHTNGIYLQRRKPSPFGRTYYVGVSVQNVNKELRRAMLGDCWEYDFRASVVTWKMTFAQELTDQVYPFKECSKLFWASTLYIQDRDDFLRDVRKDTFKNCKEISVDYQNELIKQAVTAISFGARANVDGWRDQNGQWTNTALVDIFKNPTQRREFLRNGTIQSFIKEQSMLDTYLAKGMKEELPEVYFGPLITRNIKPSMSKAVAFLYQQSETRVMNVALEVLSKQGIKPIARIHDAFIVRKKIKVDLKSEIILEMRDQSQNYYWAIKETKLDRFNFPLKQIGVKP